MLLSMPNASFLVKMNAVQYLEHFHWYNFMFKGVIFDLHLNKNNLNLAIKLDYETVSEFNDKNVILTRNESQGLKGWLA